MSRNFRKLSILLSIIIIMCLFVPYEVAAETAGNEKVPALSSASLGISANSDTPSKITEQTTLPGVVYTPATSVNPAEALDESQLLVIVDEEIPAAPAELPKTGGVPEVLFYGFGGLISAAGVMIRRKTR